MINQELRINDVVIFMLIHIFILNYTILLFLNLCIVSLFLYLSVYGRYLYALLFIWWSGENLYELVLFFYLGIKLRSLGLMIILPGEPFHWPSNFYFIRLKNISTAFKICIPTLFSIFCMCWSFPTLGPIHFHCQESSLL